ncbi:hypothetical protein QBC34DRAFT_469886, partial [Podospora aff. communis PSN243]
MSSITPFDISINLNLRGLRTLKSLLAKASSHPSSTSLPSAKFPHDAQPLAFHVQSCINLAVGGHGLLTQTEATKPDWNTNLSLEQLLARTEESITILEGAKPEELKGVEERTVQVTYGNGQTAAWGGRGYILGYNIPNFMFHLGMAYSALRSQGVEVGKMDLLGPFMEGEAPG